jgi:hypothetical protein
MRKLAFAAALMALGLPAHAYYRGFGIGEQSCGLLNKPPYPGFDGSVLTWVTGFITGVNAGADYMEGENKKTFDVAQSLAVETIMLFVKEQCQKNPDVRIRDVTLNVIKSIFTVARERRDKQEQQEQNKQNNAEDTPWYAPPGAKPIGIPPGAFTPGPALPPLKAAQFDIYTYERPDDGQLTNANHIFKYLHIQYKGNEPITINGVDTKCFLASQLRDNPLETGKAEQQFFGFTDAMAVAGEKSFPFAMRFGDETEWRINCNPVEITISTNRGEALFRIGG